MLMSRLLGNIYKINYVFGAYYLSNSKISKQTLQAETDAADISPFYPQVLRMLKLAIVVFAILQTSLSAPPASPSPGPVVPSAGSVESEPILGNSLPEQLLKSLPHKQIKELSQAHAKSDPEYGAALLYFKSPEWQKIVSELRSNPEWTAYKDFLKTAGFDLEPIIKHILHCISATNVSSAGLETVRPSVNKLMNDLKMNFAIPVIKASKKFMDQINEDEKSKKTLEILKSPKSKEMFDKVLGQPAWKKMAAKLAEMGVDVDTVVSALYAFCGWKEEVKASTVHA